ncbi:MAG: hypothetical protein ACE5ES_04255 [Candidatus Nanoarchaeia archaeon]
MYRDKRGQAAMEFLMTYGWAILAAVIVIAALAAFGVFSPGSLTPTVCTLSQPFGCTDEDFGLSAASGIDIDLTPGRGEALLISSMAFSGCGTGATWTPGALGANCPAGTTWDATAVACNHPDGQEATYVVTCTNMGAQGSKFSSNIQITYRTVGGTRDLTSTGKLSGNVGA